MSAATALDTLASLAAAQKGDKPAPNHHCDLAGGENDRRRGALPTIMRRHMETRWLEYLSTGAKKYELRPERGGWAGVREGQLIDFCGEIDEMPAEIRVKVIATQKFSTIEAALTSLGVGNVLPSVSCPDEGEEICEKLTPRARKSKIIAMELERVWAS